jgi:hypothetical protein
VEDDFSELPPLLLLLLHPPSPNPGARVKAKGGLGSPRKIRFDTVLERVGSKSALDSSHDVLEYNARVITETNFQQFFQFLILKDSDDICIKCSCVCKQNAHVYGN